MRPFKRPSTAAVTDPVARKSLEDVIDWAIDVEAAISRLGRGEAPNSTGTLIVPPIIDLSRYVYMPGRTTAQIVKQISTALPLAVEAKQHNTEYFASDLFSIRPYYSDALGGTSKILVDFTGNLYLRNAGSIILERVAPIYPGTMSGGISANGIAFTDTLNNSMWSIFNNSNAEKKLEFTSGTISNYPILTIIDDRVAVGDGRFSRVELNNNSGMDATVNLLTLRASAAHSGYLVRCITSLGAFLSGFTGAGAYQLAAGAGAGKVYTSDANGVGSWAAAASVSGWTDDGTTVRLTTISDLVGIGTTTPEAKLHVVATTNPALRVTSGTDFGGGAWSNAFEIRDATLPSTRSYFTYDGRLRIKKGYTVGGDTSVDLGLDMGEDFAATGVVKFWSANGGYGLLMPSTSQVLLGPIWRLPVGGGTLATVAGTSPGELPEEGALVYGAGTGTEMAKLQIGAADSVLTSDGVNPVWRNDIFLTGATATVSIDPVDINYPFSIRDQVSNRIFAFDAGNGTVAIAPKFTIFPSGSIGTGNKLTIQSAALTGNRTATFPDLSGGVLLDSSAIAQAQVTGLVADLAARELLANKDVASGYPGLSAGSKIAGSQITYGTAADTACVGNDVRLSNSRTPTAHNILDSTVHGDVLTAAPLRGALIYGNATPKWARLAIGIPGDILTSDGTDMYWGQPVPILEYGDSIFRIVGNLDNTKKLAFEVDGFTTATTRTLTPPNASGTLALIDLAQTFSAAQTFTAAALFKTSIVLEDPGAGTNTITLVSPATPTTHTLTLPAANASGALTNNGSGALSWAAPSSEPADNVFRVIGSADATKKLAFEVDGFTTATTRTLTPPNASTTIAGLSVAQTFTNAQTIAPGANAVVPLALIGDDTGLQDLLRITTGVGTGSVLCYTVDAIGGFNTGGFSCWTNGVGVGGSFSGFFDPSPLTASRSYSLPNVTGRLLCAAGSTITLALTKGVVVGTDPPAVAVGDLGKVDLTAQLANIAATNLSNVPPSTFYRVSIILMTTTADATAGTLAVAIGWTDNVGATTATPIAAHAMTVTGRTTGEVLLRRNSTEITYAVTATGAYNAARYAIYIRVECLG